MIISVKLGVSEEARHTTFDLEDLGVTQEEWDAMHNMAKHDEVQKAVNGLSDQPYWMVDSFDEK